MKKNIYIYISNINIHFKIRVRRRRFVPLLFFTLIRSRDRQNLVVPVKETHHMTTKEVSYWMKEIKTSAEEPGK